MNIKGGEISETGTNGHALYEIDTVKDEKAENVAKDVSITVSGGSFNGNVYSTNNKLSITGGAFTDLANAVKYAADGATIKLADDVNGQVVIPAGKSITLDLNGHKVTAPTDGKYDAIINNGTLTVTDSKKPVKSTLVRMPVSVLALTLQQPSNTQRLPVKKAPLEETKPLLVQLLLSRMVYLPVSIMQL